MTTSRRQASPARIRTIEARRDAAIELLTRLDAEAIAELAARGERVARPDGFPASLGGGAVSGGGVSRPTEAAALADTHHPDPVGVAIAGCFGALSEALGVLRDMDAKRVYVLATARDARGRISSLGSCECCGRDVACVPGDRVVSGYCSACYKAWQRYLGGQTQPDRAEFVRARRRSLEATG